jgi:biopolymer transport protein ExbD
VNQKEVTFANLEPELSTILKTKKAGEDVIVLLHADKTLNLQDVVSVIDIGNKLRVKMVLFTQKQKS